jgi:uncharacterized Zn-finger protein
MKKTAREYRKIVEYKIILFLVAWAAALHGMPEQFGEHTGIGACDQIDFAQGAFFKQAFFEGADFAVPDIGVSPNQEQHIWQQAIRHVAEPEVKHKYQCPECPKTFPYPSQLAIHARVHSGERPFACTVCPQAFKQKGLLSRHIKTHLKQERFVCPDRICKRIFFSLGGLKEHVDNVHKKMGKKHACRHCSKRFYRPHQVKKHMLTCAPELAE